MASRRIPRFEQIDERIFVRRVRDSRGGKSDDPWCSHRRIAYKSLFFSHFLRASVTFAGNEEEFLMHLFSNGLPETPLASRQVTINTSFEQ